MNLFNKLIAAFLPVIPKSIVRKISRRYIAGDTMADAVNVVRSLNAEDAMATVDVLGEYISNLQQAAATGLARLGSQTGIARIKAMLEDAKNNGNGNLAEKLARALKQK